MCLPALNELYSESGHLDKIMISVPELSNNRAERSNKPFDIDRKSFLYANTSGGAKDSTVIFTLINTGHRKRPGPLPIADQIL